MDQVVPDVKFSKKVYLKSRADWNAILHDLMALSWSDIYKNLNIIECLNDHLRLIIERRILSKLLRFCLKDKHGLMLNANFPIMQSKKLTI